MSETSHSSRRDFLAKAAGAAAAASLITSVGCSSTRGPSIDTVAGPKPRSIDSGETIRFGLIGMGGQGRHDLKTLLSLGNISIVALADPQKKSQEETLKVIKAATGETPTIYGGDEGYKELLARDDVDAILSATPCWLHGPVHLACFEAGKHFYGEKPLCIHTNEADALLEAQAKNPDIKGVIGFQRRASKMYMEGIQRIADGDFGAPIDGRGAWNNSWGPIGKPNEGPRIWLGRRELSGDWMLEQACHTWDVFGWVTGKMPTAASGIGRRDVFAEMDPDRDVTDYYIAHLEYEGGFSVDYEHSWICPRNDDHMFSGVYERVAGIEGGICLDKGKIYWRNPHQEPEVIDVGEENHINQNIDAFLGAIRTGGPVLSGVENGRLATYTGLLVRKAVDERRWVSIDELL